MPRPRWNGFWNEIQDDVTSLFTFVDTTYLIRSSVVSRVAVLHEWWQNTFGSRSFRHHSCTRQRTVCRRKETVSRRTRSDHTFCRQSVNHPSTQRMSVASTTVASLQSRNGSFNTSVGFRRAACTPSRHGACSSRTLRPVRVAANAGIELYGSSGSRSPLVDWYLHETNTPFTPRAPSAPGNPHLFGQIPALRDSTDDAAHPVELFESGAILAYLADRYGGLDTPGKRAAANKWIVWANASLDPCLFKENEEGKVFDTGARGNPRELQRLNTALATREYLVDDTFGVADVAVCSYLLYIPQFFSDASFEKWSHISKYMGRCAMRPAYGKAFGARVQDSLVKKCASWVKA